MEEIIYSFEIGIPEASPQLENDFRLVLGDDVSRTTDNLIFNAFDINFYDSRNDRVRRTKLI